MCVLTPFVRILFILRHFLPEQSGMATQMFNTVHFLKKQKMDVKVVRVLYKSEASNHEYVSETIPGSFSMEKELMRIKKKYRPDIVHFDSTWPMGRAITKVFKDETKVIGVGGRTFDEYRDYCKYTGGNRFIGKLKGVVLASVARRVLNAVDIVLAEGLDIKEHLIANGVKTTIEAINNGVDFSRFRYRPTKGKKALFFGRFSWENGPDKFIKIMEGLPEFQGTMVGYGPQESKLKELAAGTNVKVLGPVKWEGIPNLLESYDFIVLPFRRIGGISQTVTEAMAAGKTVMTTNVGDLANVIRHGTTGFFFQDDADARNLLIKVDRDSKLRRRVERAARDKIKVDLSWESVIKKYIQLYKKYQR